MEHSSHSKLKTLTLGLIFSGALNIGLMAAFGFVFLQERKPSFSFSAPREGRVLAESTLQEMLLEMSKLSFHQLVSLLTNREMVEEGYLKRDLSVAILTGLHHFDLERAVGARVQRREICWKEDQSLELFPGLTDEQFQGIIRFAYEEKWPLTPKGLFHLLKKLPLSERASLVEAFLVTPPFHALQTLFQKTDAPQETPLLVQLISEGNWDILDRFCREQEQVLDLSVEKRRRLLLGYLSLHSSTAAKLLLETDFVFVSKRLEDRGALDLIALLKEGSDVERLALEWLRSPRSDAVWSAAVGALYRIRGEKAPEPLDLRQAMDRFLAVSDTVVSAQEQAPLFQEPEAVRKAFREHVVKEGESLWKLSRLYKVKVDEIVLLNELEKERIYPGMTLRIPD